MADLDHPVLRRHPHEGCHARGLARVMRHDGVEQRVGRRLPPLEPGEEGRPLRAGSIGEIGPDPALRVAGLEGLPQIRLMPFDIDMLDIDIAALERTAVWPAPGGTRHRRAYLLTGHG